MTRVHILSGEFPPATGGIACFSEAIARGLAAKGHEVHVWTPGGAETGRSHSFTPHALPDRFGRESRRVLETAFGERDIVLLQYTPNALGCRGANVPFCRWLLGQARRGRDVRVVFHEPFFYFGWQSPARNALALVHRVMAVLLLRAARVAYVSTPAWARLLRAYARGGAPFAWVPVPSSIPVSQDPDAAARVREPFGRSLLFGHFSGYAEDVRKPLAAAIADVLARHPDSRVLCIGRGGEEFAKALGDSRRVRATGLADVHAVSAAIQACDVFLQPYPDGATTRRTSLSTLLAHGACIVTTTGIFTEPLWTHESDALALAPAGQRRAFASEVARLAASAPARRRLGERAREFYRQYLDIPHTVEALRHKGTKPRPVVVGAHFFAAPDADPLRQAAYVRAIRRSDSVRALNVQFADPRLQQHVAGVETVAVLRSDAVSVSGRRGMRKPIVPEIFDALAARAATEQVRYFLYANADVEVTPRTVDLIVQEARDVYVFARTDVAGSGEEKVLRSGIDAFAFDARWWLANRSRFRPYILGEPVWDNVYAAIALCHSDGVLVAEPGLMRHAQHVAGWPASPFAEYQRLLAALDGPYFSLWCAYYDQVRDVPESRLPETAGRVAAEVFRWRPTAVGRVLQSARTARAHLRYALAEARGAS